jgi:hypothetical protein
VGTAHHPGFEAEGRGVEVLDRVAAGGFRAERAETGPAMKISVKVNGTLREFEVQPGERVLDLLRRDHLLSVRNGCDGRGRGPPVTGCRVLYGGLRAGRSGVAVPGRAATGGLTAAGVAGNLAAGAAAVPVAS